MVFERFTPEAREVVGRAQEHAHRQGHGWIGCEHLLLGVATSTTPVAMLLRDRGAGPQALEESIAAVIGPNSGDSDDDRLLGTLGIDMGEVRRAAEAAFGTGALETGRIPRRGPRDRLGRWRRHCTGSSGNRPLSRKAKRCLELSLREALRLKHGHIGVEHIALALLARDDTAAWKVLLHLGVAPGEVRRTIEASQRRTA